MDFFTHQDQARKNTRLLVLLFSLAVLTLIGITNILVAVSYYYLQRGAKVTTAHYSASDIVGGLGWETFGSVSLVVIAVVLLAILFKWLMLGSGGKAVAEALGGRPIDPNTRDPQQRRVLNVVEEMAIASGMPVPPVYLLSHESGINAFAAGHTPADAVIGVTQGCIESFNRQQLQGVIAHEFSHILNGDMRLNLRLVAVLFGILFIGMIGELLLRSGSGYHGRYRRDSKTGQIAMLGVGLLAVGWLGSFFGRWIKSAVSRQREFLADASAVQFTRNPQGIADALKIIGGHNNHSELEAGDREEFSHMFFGSALSRLGGMFATHPPLEERIKRVEPGWNGQFIFAQPESVSYSGADATFAEQGQFQADAEKQRRQQATEAATVLAGAVLNNDYSQLNEAIAGEQDLQTISKLLTEIPQDLRAEAGDPFGAVALIFALLLDDDAAVLEKQVEYMQQCDMPGLAAHAKALHKRLLALHPSLRLPVLELCLPALKTMSEQQYKSVRRVSLLLIRADKQVSMFEWCLFHLVRHYMDAALGLAKPSRPQFKKINQIESEYCLLLSVLAWHGVGAADSLAADARQADAEKAFARGANTAGLYRQSLIAEADCDLDAFTRAVNKLANSYPLLKPRLLKGLADCAMHDDIVNPVEKEIITAVAAVIDSPLPRLK